MHNNNLWKLFVKAAQSFPNNIALSASDRDLTYSQLLNEVLYYSQYLQRLGIKSKDRVTVLLPRDSRLIVALLAVLANGACYIPLDSRYPESRIKDILQDSQ